MENKMNNTNNTMNNTMRYFVITFADYSKMMDFPEIRTELHHHYSTTIKGIKRYLKPYLEVWDENGIEYTITKKVYDRYHFLWKVESETDVIEVSIVETKIELPSK